MRVFNTLSMQKEEFEPFQSPFVKIFICGPTVYDYSHIGHARLLITYDVMARYLSDRGYKPFMLLNITDLDPKIFKRAEEEKSDYDKVRSKYIEELKHDLRLLGINTYTLARTSDYIEDAAKYVLKLMEEEYAYMLEGNTYFDTTLQGYGILSHQSIDDLNIHPVDLAQGKKNRSDFLVWNGKYSIFRGELVGMPWWHIQDTSVALTNFGYRYDIHGGASELVYPHHEAHLAQMRALTGYDKPVKYWIHTGMVNINNTKMSKSASNIVRIRDAVFKYGSDALRLYLLSNHYRKDLEFNESSLSEFVGKIEMLRSATSQNIRSDMDGEEYMDDFYSAMNDDFDTEKAIEVFIKFGEKILNAGVSKKAYEYFSRMQRILGLKL